MTQFIIHKLNFSFNNATSIITKHYNLLLNFINFIKLIIILINLYKLLQKVIAFHINKHLFTKLLNNYCFNFQ